VFCLPKLCVLLYSVVLSCVAACLVCVIVASCGCQLDFNKDYPSRYSSMALGRTEYSAHLCSLVVTCPPTIGRLHLWREVYTALSLHQRAMLAALFHFAVNLYSCYCYMKFESSSELCIISRAL